MLETTQELSLFPANNSLGSRPCPEFPLEMPVEMEETNPEQGGVCKFVSG